MEQEKKKVDRRVLYTKMFLRESLLELMKEKPIGKITPTELCRRAEINRNTFYTHYDSPEALLGSIEDELYGQVQRSLGRSLKKNDVSALLTEICQVITDNGDLCRILFSDNGDKHFLERVIHLAHDETLLAWKAAGMRGDDELLEALYTFSVSGGIAIIQHWVQSGMPESPQEVAAFIGKASYFGLQAFLQ